MTNQNDQTTKRKRGRPFGTTKENRSREWLEEDQARIQETIDRLRHVNAVAGVQVKIISSMSGVDEFRLYRANRKMGMYYGNDNRHVTFTDAELAAIGKAIDDIKAAL